MGSLYKYQHKHSERRCPQGYGYQNGITHLIACVGKENYILVLKLYREEKARKNKETVMGEYFNWNVMHVSKGRGNVFLGGDNDNEKSAIVYC